MISRIVISIITVYQYCLSAILGPTCRFYPSCSHYTKEAIQTHGLVRGFHLGSKRLLRCHPWHEGGYDPVPGKAPVSDHNENLIQK